MCATKTRRKLNVRVINSSGTLISDLRYDLNACCDKVADLNFPRKVHAKELPNISFNLVLLDELLKAAYGAASGIISPGETQTNEILAGLHVEFICLRK